MSFTSILIAILFFSLMIFVHELGHFISARCCGVRVLEFAIGMGPKIIGRKSKKSGTEYSVRLFPIGGFCSMLGEEEEVSDDHALCRRPPWQRLIILCAGSFMNILTAILAMFIMLFSQQAYYSTKVDGFTSETAASMQAGLRSGDVIIAVNNQKVNVFNDIAYAVMREGTSPCDITVMRNGEKIVINDVVFPTYTEKSVTYGELDFRTTVVGKSFGEALKQSVYQSFSTLKLIYQSLLDLITGKYGIDSVSGPVGTVEQIGEVAQNSDFRTLLFLYVFISMNLGVFNLLPLPALDGGRIIFVLLEMIRRKPIDPKYENYVHLAGFAVLIMFMGVITVLDIIKIVK